MRPGRRIALLIAFSSSFPLISSAFDCHHIRDSGVKWDLSPLEGQHHVSHIDDSLSNGYRNVTFTIDICHALRRTKETNSTACHHGTWVCAQERTYTNNEDHEPEVDDAWSVAGNPFFDSGRTLDPVPTRLKGSTSNNDAKQEGLRIELGGGIHGKIHQKVIAELICDPNRTGNEGDDIGDDKEDDNDSDDDAEDGDKQDNNGDGRDGNEDEDEGDKRKQNQKRQEDGKEEGDSDDDKKEPEDSGRSLTIVDWDPEAIIHEKNKDVQYGVLRLQWRTKYACEDAANDDKDNSRHWGFIPWFIIIAFLAVAAYLIFGSWLNYNRHGARGWDLLPHGDTIRDIPYLLKDWGRRVVSTVRGGSGGYSAV